MQWNTKYYMWMYILIKLRCKIFFFKVLKKKQLKTPHRNRTNECLPLLGKKYCCADCMNDFKFFRVISEKICR